MVVTLEFFQNFFGTLNHVLTLFVSEAVENLSRYISTSVRVFGIIVLILGAIDLFYAPFTQAVTRYLKIFFLIALVSNIATVPANYNSLIAVHLMALPDDLLTALDPQGMGSAGDIGIYLDKKIGSMLQGIVNMWGACGWGDIGGFLLSLSMFGLLCMLSVSMVISITIGKVGIALVVAAGPLMILGLISPWSRAFFTRWISFALMFAVLQLLIGGVMLIAAEVLRVYAEVLNPAGGNPPSPQNLGGMFAPAVAMFVLTYLFVQLPQMASSLTGGIGLAAGNAAWDIASRQRSFGGGGSSGQSAPGGGGGSVRNAGGSGATVQRGSEGGGEAGARSRGGSGGAQRTEKDLAHERMMDDERAALKREQDIGRAG